MINIEQRAILRYLHTAGLSHSCQEIHGDDEPRKPPSTGGSADISVAGPRESAPSSSLPPCSDGDDDYYCPDLQSLDSDEEDCISLSSSCSSTSSYSRAGTDVRRVSFAAPLVTEVKTRPRTEEVDKPLLFYSEKETTRFRQQYRQERKSLSEEEGYDDVHNVKLSSTDENCGRRRISRVVVDHNDSLETFYDSGSLSASSSSSSSANDVFFDNDNFWNGSLTWF